MRHIRTNLKADVWMKLRYVASAPYYSEKEAIFMHKIYIRGGANIELVLVNAIDYPFYAFVYKKTTK